MQAFKNFRTYFLRGIAALLPTVLTIWIFIWCYGFIGKNIAKPINQGIVKILVLSTDWYPVSQEEKLSYAHTNYPELTSQPDLLNEKISEASFIQEVRIEKGEDRWVSGSSQFAGFLIAIIGVCFLGVFLASFVGRRLWHMIENAIGNIPLVRKVYPYIKEITEFFLAKKKMAFDNVVAIQYPRKGVWSVALVTGTGLKKVANEIGKEILTVFVPTSPTPFTGYVIMTLKEETIALDMTVEEAMRFTISGGVITPAEHAAFEAMVNKEKDD
ncbi:MAG: DUF502 domain-containing protein [Planctomycetes bacterium]|nr:DUF502 domain-containing protein [Planctomycetota bacterium]